MVEERIFLEPEYPASTIIRMDKHMVAILRTQQVPSVRALRGSKASGNPSRQRRRQETFNANIRSDGHKRFLHGDHGKRWPESKGRSIGDNDNARYAKWETSLS
jgi:hypothetical protein